MTIEFKNNIDTQFSASIEGCSNSDIFFNEEQLKSIPNTAGVYIAGVVLMVNNKPQFCPLYVGQTTKLQERITNHRKYSGGYLNTRKELFDIAGCSIENVYSDIKVWNENHWNFLSVYRPAILPVPALHHPLRNVPQENNKYNLYQNIRGQNNSMIYFNCPTFFDYYLRTPRISSYSFRTCCCHDGAIGDLVRIASDSSNKLADKIKNAKAIIFNNFYYAYWEDTSDDKSYREQVEAETKYSLECLSIYTYGDCSGKKGGGIYRNLHNTPSILSKNIINLNVVSTIIYNPNKKNLTFNV